MSEIEPIVKCSNKKVASFVTTAVALELVGLFGLGFATNNIPGISLLATTSIFIDGTKDFLPNTNSQAPDRMRGTLQGALDQCPSASACAGNVYVQYPRDFGILTGGVGYNQSESVATTNTIAAIKQAQADNPPGSTIYVVAYSQGANAASDAMAQIEANNAGLSPSDPNYINQSNITYVLMGNPARNDGGLFASLPAGVYVPLLGVSFGQSTNPITPSEDPNAPQVIMISKQYDGASDVPKYVLANPVAAANAALGFLYVHTGGMGVTSGNGYYQDVDMDLNNDGQINQADVVLAQADNAHYIVTTNNNVTNIVIINQPGDLPLEQPLKALGVPDSVILAIDPLLRAMVEAGYDRVPDGGVYPATPVHFGLLPGPSQSVSDFASIALAAKQTESNLDDLNQVNALQANQLQVAKVAAPAVAPPPPPAPAELPVKQHKWPTFDVSQPVAPAPLAIVEETPPVVEVTPPAVEETAASRQVLVVNQTLSGGSTTVSPSGSTGGGSALPVLKKVSTAINGVVTGALTAIHDALTPKKPSTPAPAASDPATTP